MNYRVIKRKNILTKVYAYYATCIASGESTLDMIAQKIESRCTVTRPDIVAVLAAFNDDIIDRLVSGQIVRLGELGSIQFGLSSAASATEDTFKSDLIRSAHVKFRAGAKLKAAVKTVSYKRVYPAVKATKKTDTGGKTTPAA